jgi:hypothetical protein
VVAVLVDHNIEGQAALLWEEVAAQGWLELVEMTLITFTDAGLPRDTPDRALWRFAQERDMLLLTANRNMTGADSLERTIREESVPTSLPVITIGRSDRIEERDYRRRCAEWLVDIVLYLDRYRGGRRLFIP